MAVKLQSCPYCGQQHPFIEQLGSDASVVICQSRTGEHSACLARGPVGVQQHEFEDQPGHDQAVQEWNNRAAPQPHVEPITWMADTAFWWTKEEAGRDAAATGMLIVGLGPMADKAAVERLRDEVENQRRLKRHVAENLQNALDNCAVYRAQLEEQRVLLHLSLMMINRGS